MSFNSSENDQSIHSRSSDKEKSSDEINDWYHLIFRKRSLRDYLDLSKTWLFSVVLHLLLIFPLMFYWVSEPAQNRMEVISAPGDGETLSNDDFFNDSAPVEKDFNVGMDAVTVERSFDSLQDKPTVLNTDPVERSLPLETENTISENIALNGLMQMGRTEDPYQGRGADKRSLLAAGGGSSGSERAVGSALEWLARHQCRDGHWSFQLEECESCKGKCKNSGSKKEADAGATALALLPFLSSGNTPFKGKYRTCVRTGISWLLDHARFEAQTISFRDGGTMYSHGMAALALSETYEMMSKGERKKWPAVGVAAMMSAAYIADAQDPVTGGWRYVPRQAGDTSVTGWQVMALKSLTVDEKDQNRRKEILKKALHFFKNVTAYEKGSRYGYNAPKSGTNAVTAVGLLCRLYLDWGVDQPELLQGADYLLENGPDIGNPYYTYYTTLLMFNIGGKRWSKWNNSVRDALIEQQEISGHEKGSWYPDDDSRGFCGSGGRLYVTALNCMSLQVYYRYLPLYKSLGNESKFPVD